jgi:hypothetical protein
MDYEDIIIILLQQGAFSSCMVFGVDLQPPHGTRSLSTCPSLQMSRIHFASSSERVERGDGKVFSFRLRCKVWGM